MTIDVDILVLAADAPGLYRELGQAGCKRRGTQSIGCATWELPDGTLLDVTEADQAWAEEAFRNPEHDASRLPIIALPYLVLMKLGASRVQDLADITRMLGAADERALADVREIIRTYAGDTLEDLESMIVLGKMEMEDARPPAEE